MCSRVPLKVLDEYAMMGILSGSTSPVITHLPLLECEPCSCFVDLPFMSITISKAGKYVGYSFIMFSHRNSTLAVFISLKSQ